MKTDRSEPLVGLHFCTTHLHLYIILVESDNGGIIIMSKQKQDDKNN